MRFLILYFRAFRFVHKVGKKVCLFAVLAIFVGCAQSNSYLFNDKIPLPPHSARVLLMQPDVLLSEIKAGGLQEPRADWTATAKTNIKHVLNDISNEKNDLLTMYERQQDNQKILYSNRQLMKLHEAVGESILLHKYLAGFGLPTKAGKFDWTLGDKAQNLQKSYNADVALFIYIRDSYASAGRKLAMAAGAVLGFYVPGGLQVGFASLVDLQSGRLIWFNKLFRQTGDLRALDNARDAVNQLLEGIPL